MIYNNVERPLCNCGRETPFINFRKGFREFCSPKCSRNGVSLISPYITKQYIVENLMRKDGCLNQNKTKHLKESNEDLYIIYNKIKRPKCECGNLTHYIGFKLGFRETCSNKCSNSSEKTKNKSKNTNIKNHGFEHHTQSGEFNYSGYKYKDYVLPSGKILKIQGYENYLLDELLEIYKENEILTDRKDMPEFWYHTKDNKRHRYFPDAYVPKEKTIYEVKCSYTLSQSKKNGIFNLKEKSVLSSGLKFELKVYG